jgi:hypothetical protein
MAITISPTLKRQMLDGTFNSAAGVNYDAGVLEIRSGAAPGPEAAETGTLLASIAVPADGFAAASGSSVAKIGTWSDTAADGTGTAAHFRMRRSGDVGGASTITARIEGTVTATGGGGDIELDNVSIATGQTATITALSFNL